MVYYCIRCGYDTKHKNYMKVHFNHIQLCPMDVFLFLTKEEQYELSLIPYKKDKYERKDIIKILSMGPMNTNDYLKIMQREIKYQKYSKEEEGKKEEKKKKEYQCTSCGNLFFDKSGLNRHIMYQRCKILKLYKGEEIENETNMTYQLGDVNKKIEETKEEVVANTYQVKFDISHMNDLVRILNIFKKGNCYPSIFEWFYENSRNWSVFMENEMIDWVIIFDQSNLLDKKLRLMNFDLFLDELIKKININIQLYMDKLKKDLSMKVILEMYNQLKREKDEIDTNIVVKAELVKKIKNKIVENRDKVIHIFHNSMIDYRIYSF